jgi:hypothetical protein
MRPKSYLFNVFLAQDTRGGHSSVGKTPYTATYRDR